MKGDTGAEDKVFGAADALAAAIQREPRWVEWYTAMAAVDGNEDLNALFAQYRDLSRRVRAGEGDARDVAKVADRIQKHPAYRRREDAAEAMIGLLREVDSALSQKLGVEFAATAAPKKSGSCCG